MDGVLGANLMPNNSSYNSASPGGDCFSDSSSVSSLTTDGIDRRRDSSLGIAGGVDIVAMASIKEEDGQRATTSSRESAKENATPSNVNASNGKATPLGSTSLPPPPKPATGASTPRTPARSKRPTASQSETPTERSYDDVEVREGAEEAEEVNVVVAKGGDHIRTACRVRPMLERELGVGRNNVPGTPASTPMAQRLQAQLAAKSSRCVEVLPPPPVAPDFGAPQSSGEPPRPPVSTTVSISKQNITFDFVADEGTPQQQIYEELGEPLVQNCIDGYNASILCYGQTGSGKSYTMFGNSNFFSQQQAQAPSVGGGSSSRNATAAVAPKTPGGPEPAASSSSSTIDPFLDEERGLVPRILEALWQPSHAAGASPAPFSPFRSPLQVSDDAKDVRHHNSSRLSAEFSPGDLGALSPSELRRQSTSVAIARKLKCRCSFYEIYQERVFDLLNLDPSHTSAGLNVREDALLGVYVANLTERLVSSHEEAREVMLQGYANRRVAETAMNRESSRSHAIFQLLLEFSECRNDGAIVTKAAKMCMVDLAGSERQRDTLATNTRLKEAAAINKSLSTLGRVINSLVDAAVSGAKAYIPYRDSKLTFLLKDALGGNSKTTLVATVSPSIESMGDTLSTLKFVNRAKRICTAAICSEKPLDSIIELQREIAKLRAQVLGQTRGGESSQKLSSETRELLTLERIRSADLASQLDGVLLANAQLELQVQQLNSSLEQMRLDLAAKEVQSTNTPPPVPLDIEAADEHMPVPGEGGCFSFLPWLRSSKSRGGSKANGKSSSTSATAAAAGKGGRPASPAKPPKKSKKEHKSKAKDHDATTPAISNHADGDASASSSASASRSPPRKQIVGQDK